MWRVTIKGLLAHKLRLALTALAIVLGVMFIAGTFVLTDTLHNTFKTLFGNIYQNIDFQVRGVAQFGSGGTATRNPDPRVAPGHGAQGARGRGGERHGLGLRAIHRARTERRSPPAVRPPSGSRWTRASRLSTLHLVQGSPPTTAHDVVMDLGTAQKYDFKVGQQVRVLL